MALSKDRAAAKGFLEAAAERRAAADHRTVVEVPEFSAEGEPPVKVYGKTPTIYDRAAIERAATDPETGHVNRAEAAIRTVIQLACDEAGARLFDAGSAQFMRTQIPADVIEALAFRLNAGLSYEAAKKN
ncbi:MAG: hypothetical protein ACOC20_01060 [Oceanicaulis sp.]